MMKHKHRIVPGHMGGTYDPENVIELTIPEHAEAHKKLYEQYGNEYDRIAWKSLSGHIGKEEASHLAMKEAGRKRAAQMEKEGNPMADPNIKAKHLKRMREMMATDLWKKQHQAGMDNRVAPDTTGDKNAFWNKKHSQESLDKMSKNSSGFFWINNGIESQNCRGEIPEGFVRGRFMTEGLRNTNKGNILTEQHKQNISDGMKRAAAARGGIEPPMS